MAEPTLSMVLDIVDAQEREHTADLTDHYAVLDRQTARIAELESALCRIAYMHQEIDAQGSYEKLGRAQMIARRAIDHLGHRKAEQMAAQHQQDEHDASRALGNKQ